jgi:hypothetical protein
VEMNHHCDKLVYATDPQDMAKVDPAMGGLIEEFTLVRSVVVWPPAPLRDFSAHRLASADRSLLLECVGLYCISVTTEPKPGS